MAQIITLAAAYEQWNEGGGMGSPVEIFGADDTVALSESWNNYTDSLCKDGQLNDLQYHYAPSYDEVTHSDHWGCELAFLLDAMGVEMAVQPCEAREGWHAGASHWDVTITRSDKTIQTKYSVGSAHKGEPEIEDVVGCLLKDSEYGGDTFEEWADNMGYDTDSRKAYATWEACNEIANEMKAMFNSSELADLTEIANEM